MKKTTIKVQIENKPGVSIPKKATDGSAGYDVCSAEELVLEAGEFRKIATGIRLSLPNDVEVQIRPRSGLAFKHGITVLNSPGTIDSDYRGEVCILLINHSKVPFRVEVGMRIAQMIFSKMIPIDFELRSELDESIRGSGGFGSTGAI